MENTNNIQNVENSLTEVVENKTNAHFCKKCGKPFSEKQLEYFAQNNIPVPDYCKNCRKSKAKAAGLKSSFNLGDGTALITSFGSGNTAVKEKKIDKSGNVSNLKTDQSKLSFSFDRVEDSNVYEINKGLNDNPVLTLNPVSMSRMSAVRLNGYREKIEELYFGKTFTDNIHIQIAYNIMDIEKILAIHINNIIYTIDNIFRIKNNENEDFIGYMSAVNKYPDCCNVDSDDFKNKKNELKNKQKEYLENKKNSNLKKEINKLNNEINFIKLIGKNQNNKKNKTVYNPRLGYFGDAFKINGNYDPEHIYTILCILGQIRQMLAHSNPKTRSFMYNLAETCNGYKNNNWDMYDKYVKIKKLLNTKYNGKVKELNENFIDKSKVNLTALFQVYECDNTKKPDIIKKYYDFIVRKENKNMGFSIKKLREEILEKHKELADEIEDCCRNKTYRLLDFIIWDYYASHQTHSNEIVERLRRVTDEDAKVKIYEEEAQRLYKSLEKKINSIAKNFVKGNQFVKEDQFGKTKVDSFLYREEAVLGEYKIGTEADYFTKMIYLITLFIDAKEINDLVTTLINKFDNIASLLSVIDDTDKIFVPEFSMFKKSNKIQQELRILNSFARMQKPSEEAKNEMLKDAMKVLGFKDDNINETIKGLQNKEKEKHGKRNFIINNVIESNRFNYLVRYTNTEKVAELRKNAALVKFVIGRLPDTQIDRYYYDLSKKEKDSNDSKQQKIETLAKIIQEMSFDKISNELQDKLLNTENLNAKKACVSFYLMFLYHLTKNLVYVNHRYFIAFHCLERDVCFYNKNNYNRNSAVEECVLTQIFLDEEEKNCKNQPGISKSQQRANRWASLINQDIKFKIGENNEVVKDMRTKYRNAVAHLNIPRNANEYIDKMTHITSYFSIYHYMMQNYLLANMPDESKGYLEKYIRNGFYYKDLVKALNVPFAYNLPRFKSLSVESLFDMNEVVESEPLSTKQDAYSACLQKEKADLIPEGKILEGKVISVTKFGAFVLLDKYKVSGLIYDKEIKNKLKIGDKVEVKAGEPHNGKLSLLLIKKNE